VNAEELTQEVADIIQDSSYTGETILSYLNRGQVAVAGSLLLPGLADGHSTVTTAVDGYSVALPADFHRELYHAQVDGRPVKVYRNMGMIIHDLEKITAQAGQLEAVCPNAGNLLYQKVPSIAKDVELFYYRLPIDMTDEDENSRPDGLSMQAGVALEHFDFALVHYAAAFIFDRIEDGIEGQKVNTLSHRDQYALRLSEMALHVREGRPHAPPPVAGVNW
jgi:hypothetical protein